MFDVGDIVWVPDCGNERVPIPCPVCFGKKEVTLILGDESMVVLPCEGCGNGFEGPRGFVMEYRPNVGASQRIIKEVRVKNTASGQEIEYLSNEGWILRPESTFSTKEEAEKNSVAKKEILEKEESLRVKHKDSKSYSWNALYHMRQVKDAQQKIDYHSKMARICKDRTRGNDG